MGMWPQLASRNAGKCYYTGRGNRIAELMAGTFTDWLNAWMLSCIWLFVILRTVACQGFSRQEYWSGWPCPPPGNLPNPGNEPTLQADSLLAELPGKPKKTGVDSLSLLQGIFLTRDSNQDLLHCRQILYQLSYQGSPRNLWNNGVYLYNSKMSEYLYSSSFLKIIDMTSGILRSDHKIRYL